MSSSDDYHYNLDTKRFFRLGMGLPVQGGTSSSIDECSVGYLRRGSFLFCCHAPISEPSTPPSRATNAPNSDSSSSLDDGGVERGDEEDDRSDTATLTVCSTSSGSDANVPLSKSLIRHIINNRDTWHNQANSVDYQVGGLGLDVQERDMIFVSGVTTLDWNDILAMLATAELENASNGLPTLEKSEHESEKIPEADLDRMSFITLCSSSVSEHHWQGTPRGDCNSPLPMRRTFLHFYKVRRCSIVDDYVRGPVSRWVEKHLSGVPGSINNVYNPVDVLLNYITRKAPVYPHWAIASDKDLYTLFGASEGMPNGDAEELRKALESLNPTVRLVDVGASKPVAALDFVCDTLEREGDIKMYTSELKPEPAYSVY